MYPTNQPAIEGAVSVTPCFERPPHVMTLHTMFAGTKWMWDKYALQRTAGWKRNRASLVSGGIDGDPRPLTAQLDAGDINVVSSSILGDACGFGLGLRDVHTWSLWAPARATHEQCRFNPRNFEHIMPMRCTDVPAQPWGAWLDVLYCRHLLQPRENMFFDGNEATRWGTANEPRVMALYNTLMAERNGGELAHEGGFARRSLCAEHPTWIVSDSPDGFVTPLSEPMRVLEFKAPMYILKETAPGLPPGLTVAYLLQCFVHMYCTRCESCDFLAVAYNEPDSPKTFVRIYWDDAVWQWVVAQVVCYVAHARVLDSGKYDAFRGNLMQFRRAWIAQEGACCHTRMPFPVASVCVQEL